jgi:hypothetical protein
MSAAAVFAAAHQAGLQDLLGAAIFKYLQISASKPAN